MLITRGCVSNKRAISIQAVQGNQFKNKCTYCFKLHFPLISFECLTGYYLVLYSQIIYLLYILSWPSIYYLCSHVYFLLFIFPHGFIYDIIILVEDQLSPICFLVFVRLFLCNPIHPFKRLIILNVTNRLALDGNMNIFYVHARMREPL